MREREGEEGREIGRKVKRERERGTHSVFVKLLTANNNERGRERGGKEERGEGEREGKERGKGEGR